MKIHVSKDVENVIHAAVLSGQFDSAGDMLAKLVRDYAHNHSVHSSDRPATGDAEPDMGSIGAMHDAADELDQAMAHVMSLRQQPWRISAGE